MLQPLFAFLALASSNLHHATAQLHAVSNDHLMPRAANPFAGFASWPTAGPGHPITERQQPSDELTSMLNNIDPARVKAIIDHLVTYGTRHTLSVQDNATHGIGGARDWIASEMRKIAETSNGKMTITTPSYIQQPDGDRIDVAVNITDIVATLEGETEPNRVYVVSGHYDSRNTDIMDRVNAAPGADDDASGVAVAMELARVFAKARPAATMIFTAVAGEEQGLFGADHLAGLLKNASADVQGMFTNDIVGASKTGDGLNISDPNSIRLFAQGMPTLLDSGANAAIAELASAGGENDSPARELGRFTAEVASNDVTNMSVRVIYRLDRVQRGGDHEPFLERGFPANRFTEPYEDFRHQHQDVRVDSNGVQFGDLAEFVDFDFTTRVAKVNGAAMWSLANAPGTPKNVVLDTSGVTNNSTLTWDADFATGLAGYEVVWRPSDSAFWTNVVPVGNVLKVVLPLDKDNVHMGVRAVGTNGMRSPAAFPTNSVG